MESIQSRGTTGEVRPPVANLTRLYYFSVLAEELHFGRAASRLNLAQPALSQQMKALEAELAVRLLDRGRETTLTDAGRQLQEDAVRLLHDAEAIVERVRVRGAGGSGRLSLAHTRSATHLGTTDVVQLFRDRFPGVQVSVDVAWTTYNIEMLRSHEIDVAFVRPPINEPDLEFMELAREEVVVALPPGHRLTDLELIDRADLMDEEIIMWPRKNGPGHYDRIISQIWGTEHPRVVVEEPDDEQILVAVASGRGVAVLERRRSLRLRTPEVAIRSFVSPAPTCLVGVAWRKGHATPEVERFVALCEQYSWAQAGLDLAASTAS